MSDTPKTVPEDLRASIPILKRLGLDETADEFEKTAREVEAMMADNADLKRQLAEAQKVIRNAHAEYATAPGLECSCKYCINADIKELE